MNERFSITPKSLAITGALVKALHLLFIAALLIAALGAAPAQMAQAEATGPAGAVSPEAPSFAAARPLADCSTRMGRWTCPPASEGSVDARDWRLVSGAGEAPRFAPLATAGDENWADDFAPPGPDDTVSALAVDGSEATSTSGGSSPRPGARAANHVARWDGSSWSALGSGMNAVSVPWRWTAAATSMRAEISPRPGARRRTTSPDGTAAPGAPWAWDGQHRPWPWRWTAAGTVMPAAHSPRPEGGGANNVARGTAAAGVPWAAGWTAMSLPWRWMAAANLCRAAVFTTAGGAAANHVAGGTAAPGAPGQRDGRALSLALAVDGNGNLYAGRRIHRRPGARCQPYRPVGRQRLERAGQRGWAIDVYALAVDGSGNLYAGGQFTTAGGVPANRSPAGMAAPGPPWAAGMDDDVSALAVDGSGNLLRAAISPRPAGCAANYVARWDGSAWHALGSGMDGDVMALAVDGSGNLYAGGQFTKAGGASGQLCRPLGRQRLVAPWAAGMDDECLCPGGGRQRQPVCRRQFHHGGWGARPTILPAGTAAPGMPWAAGWTTSVVPWPWMAAATCTPAVGFTTAGGATRQLHRPLGRQRLVGPGQRDGRQSLRPGGGRQRQPVRRR